jgi:hypothetical protein
MEILQIAGQIKALVFFPKMEILQIAGQIKALVFFQKWKYFK